MKLWRLFPKYKCKLCKDRGVIETVAALRVCECRLSDLEKMRRAIRDIQELLAEKEPQP